LRTVDWSFQLHCRSLALSACATKEIKVLPPVADNTTYGNTGDTVTPSGPAMHSGQPGRFRPVGWLDGAIVIYLRHRPLQCRYADQATLQTQAQWLARYPNARVTLEGHADERGTRDYNLALGERRANAAKNYLASLGVDASRIQTVSYGKERPQALGSNEEAWAQNRRAVTVVVR
jgi:peptidoglycan-associated lipoprotein